MSERNVHVHVMFACASVGTRKDTLFPYLTYNQRRSWCMSSVDMNIHINMTNDQQDIDIRRSHGVAYYSVTDTYTANAYVDVIRALIGNQILPITDTSSTSTSISTSTSTSTSTPLLPLHITDATASIGGNTLSFISSFTHTHTCELTSDRYQCLQYNMNMITNNTTCYGSVCCYQGNYLDIMNIWKQNIVFLDPPCKSFTCC